MTSSSRPYPSRREKEVVADLEKPPSNLDSFVHHSRPPPQPLATSQEIRDRGSAFVANLFRASTPNEARAAINHLKLVVHAQRPASHEIAAWRCMVLKPGETGLEGPEDFELKTGSQDDGEQWAGGRVLKVMHAEGAIDAVVVVSRWYGGILLGPARFTHIETCAQEVCRTFVRKEELDECLSNLATLDDLLAQLRTELANLSSHSESTNDVTPKPSKKPDYSSLIKDNDLGRAKRLVNAREQAIQSVKSLIQKKKS